MSKNLTCIVCPLGCKMTIKQIENSFIVSGNACKRGEKYAIEELTNPTRKVPTTVKIKGAFLKRLPVITNEPIPKGMIFEVMDVINKAEAIAPIDLGDIIIKNILNTGVDIVATRSMSCINPQLSKEAM